MSQIEPVQKVEEALSAIESDSRDRPTLAQVERVQEDTKRTGHVLLAIATLIAITIGFVGIVYASENSKDVAALSARATVNDDALKSLNEANEKLIAKGIAPIPVPTDGSGAVDANALAQAAAALVLADPRFAGITVAELQRRVDDYFFTHPSQGKPTTEEVTRIVAQVYADNPPKPGRAPTPEEIFAGVSAYCANDACQGLPGKTGPVGPTGPKPTPEEIQASVDKYCSSGACASKEPGPVGPVGPSGPTPTSAEFIRSNGSCQYRTNYSNGSTIDASAPDSMCPVVPTTTTTP